MPWTDDLQVIYEHYHRYALAARFVAGARVLDLGCGEGFGPALLARGAREVIGVDIDPLTVEHASAHYQRENLHFTIGSMIDPELLAGAEQFDVITCFEALEHVVEQDTLMALVRGLLAPGGLFLTSTPDITVYSHEHGNDNPFHVRELTEPEFRELLGGSFGHFAVLRQNVAVGSLITGDPQREASWSGAGQSLQRDPDGGWSLTEELPHTYFLGIASDAPLPVVPEFSVLIDPDLSLVRDPQRALMHERERHEHSRAQERDAAARCLEQVHIELVTAQRDAEQARAQVAQQQEIAGAAQRRAAEWEAEAQALRAEQSATAQRLISGYRRAVERAAPRGTRRRDFYERAWGRQPSAVPEPQASGPVRVRTSSTPVVSIIVPVHGKWNYTQQCLASIEASRATVPFEVLVVDDASPDHTAEMVAASTGVRLVRAERNLGFVGACNLGAGHAEGIYLLFLNNDTEVRPGWLDALVGTAESDEEIGLVGAQLVYPDGRLQESGGIIWADGSGWNYGRHLDAGAAEFQVRRDVDYCSGAAILVRRKLFDLVGGFDKQYAPAYYEDTDLAFAIRATGHRTVVQPQAVVVHHEGISHGTDTATGIKRYQEINRALFVEKWGETLTNHLAAPSARNLWLARHRGPAGHHGGLVLVADHQIPTPDRDSGSMRMHRLLLELVALGERVVFFPSNGALLQPYTSELRQQGITVIPDGPGQSTFLREAGEALTLAVLSRPHVAWSLIEQLRERAPRCLVGYDTVDLHFLRL
ncbi:MAG: glycosyltransferase, partial [Pseudonocardiaceae bacterium]